MSIVINLEPEEEDALVRLAAERGLTPEAYVHTLILGLTHAGKEGQKSSLVARLRSAIAGFQRSHPFSDLADDELRAMRTRVSEHKERVVEAIAQAEMLDRMRERRIVGARVARDLSRPRTPAVSGLRLRMPQGA